MLHKCPCQKCGVNIEFETEQANEFVDCPSCNEKTRLLMGKERPGASLGKIHVNLMRCPDCGGEISIRALMCPHCGSTASVRFKLVWDVMCHVGMVGLIFAGMAWVIDLGINALITLFKVM